MAHIFVSYARKDADAANRLVGTLAEAGYEAWIDREIPGGELWKKRVVEAIEGAHAFLILLSPSSVASDNVRKELDVADSRKKLILPLVIAPMKVPPEMEYSLAGLQRIDFASDANAGQKHLLNAMKSLHAIEQQSADWVSLTDTKEGRKELNAILTDPVLSDRDRARRQRKMDDSQEPGVPSAERLQSMTERAVRRAERRLIVVRRVQSRRDAIDAKRDDLRKKRETLTRKLEGTSSAEIANQIQGELAEIRWWEESLASESRSLTERISLLGEVSTDRDKILEEGRRLLEESNKLIERIWKKDG